jgi:hypothetical protein
MAALATVANMRKFEGVVGLCAYDPSSGAQYSANHADYWWAEPEYVLRNEQGEALVLVKVQQTVEPIGSENQSQKEA